MPTTMRIKTRFKVDNKETKISEISRTKSFDKIQGKDEAKTFWNKFVKYIAMLFNYRS